ncbi:MAG: hypothetical protein J0L92_14060 [Deltaproteobacteria bacterium]|nr:hypothetical protein [Deltaproteobacteria bacterium]
MTFSLRPFHLGEFQDVAADADFVRMLARRAPPDLEFLRVRDANGWVEVLRDGTFCTPRRIAILPPVPEDDGTQSIDEFMGPEHWVYFSPEADGGRGLPDLPNLLLPRLAATWDFPALAADPVCSNLIPSHFANMGDMEVELEHWLHGWGEEGRSLLEGALTQHIILVYP